MQSSRKRNSDRAEIADPQAARARQLSELNSEAQKFITEVENALKTPVTLLSTGPEVYDMIDLRRDTRPLARGTR